MKTYQEEIAELEDQIGRLQTQLNNKRQEFVKSCTHPVLVNDAYRVSDGWGGDDWVDNFKCKICGSCVNKKD